MASSSKYVPTWPPCNLDVSCFLLEWFGPLARLRDDTWPGREILGKAVPWIGSYISWYDEGFPHAAQGGKVVVLCDTPLSQMSGTFYPY
jgi:hypothetical protein